MNAFGVPFRSIYRGFRKFVLLVAQGSQSLALGLTTTAASQLVEYWKRE